MQAQGRLFVPRVNDIAGDMDKSDLKPARRLR